MPGSSEHRRVVRAAGWPPTYDPWVYRSIRIRGRWSGFTLEAVTARVGLSPEEMKARGEAFIVAPLEEIGETWVLKPARVRVLYRTAWIEVRWHLRGGRSKPRVGGDISSLDRDAWASLGRARELLNGYVANLGGRPPGTHATWREALPHDERRDRAKRLADLVSAGVGLQRAGTRWHLGRRAVKRELDWLAGLGGTD